MGGKVDPKIKPKANPTPGSGQPVPSSVGSPGSKGRLRPNPDDNLVVKAWTEEERPDYPPFPNPSDYEFTIVQSDDDMLSQTVKSSWVPCGPKSFSLAKDFDPKPTQLLAHANNKVTLKNMTDNPPSDASVGRKIHRTWRQWAAPLDPTDRDKLKPPGKYNRGTNYPGFERDGFDHVAVQGGWADIPGFEQGTRRQANERVRVVSEFMVNAEKHPELDAIAFLIVLDHTPTHYRMRQSKATKVPSADWKARTRDEATIEAMVSEKKPIPDPDTLAASDWATDTGWVDWSAEVAKLPP